jgi:hypothetical protein
MNPRGTLINEQQLLECKNHVKLHHSYIFFLYQLGVTTIFATIPLQKKKTKKKQCDLLLNIHAVLPPRKRNKSRVMFVSMQFCGRKKKQSDVCEGVVLWKKKCLMFVNMWFWGNKKTE